MGRSETAWLTHADNLSAFDLPGSWIVHAQKPPKMIILDMDSSESPTHGRQEGSAYNGHFGCTCYHPLFCFNQFGDLEWSLLRRDPAPQSPVGVQDEPGRAREYDF